MITLVEARTQQGALLSLPLDDVSSGIVIQDIGGLDPVKATIVSSSFAGRDGSQYQSSKREARNITIKFGIEPDYVEDSVRDIRIRLMAFFMPKSQVSLRFYDSDGLTVEIAGRVESFDSPLFAAEPTADISIVCFDPDFIERTPVVLSGSSVSSTANTHLFYPGSIETGFKFVLNVNRSLTQFTLYNTPADNSVRVLDFAASLIAGDTVTISTVAGAKSVTLTRAGINSSLLYGMSSQSDWLEFFPGDNFYRVYAVGAAIPYSITYTTRHGGL